MFPDFDSLDQALTTAPLSSRECIETRFGGRLAMLRRKHGFSIEDLAFLSGMGREQLHAMEQGHTETALEALSALAEAFCMPLSAFLKGV